jgi:transposase
MPGILVSRRLHSSARCQAVSLASTLSICACAAWIGLTPKDHSTAGKLRLGGITRAGDEGLRSVLVVGATAVIQHAQRGGRPSPWLTELLKRKSPKLAAVALANKMARIAWKLMVTGENYAAKAAPAALADAA